METVIYEGIPNYSKEVRQKVFVEGYPHIWMKKSL